VGLGNELQPVGGALDDLPLLIAANRASAACKPSLCNARRMFQRITAEPGPSAFETSSVGAAPKYGFPSSLNRSFSAMRSLYRVISFSTTARSSTSHLRAQNKLSMKFRFGGSLPLPVAVMIEEIRTMSHRVAPVGGSLMRSSVEVKFSLGCDEVTTFCKLPIRAKEVVSLGFKISLKFGPRAGFALDPQFGWEFNRTHFKANRMGIGGGCET
jgi:hypothetical protein